MRRALPIGATVAVLAATTAAIAASPSRPLPLTSQQLAAVRQAEAQPQHAAVRGVHASYKSDRERNLDFVRASDDFWTAAYQGGFPGAILTVLICAAPL